MGGAGHATTPVTDMVVVDLYRFHAAPGQLVGYPAQPGRHDVSRIIQAHTHRGVRLRFVFS